jgi:hypothetical protein
MSFGDYPELRICFDQLADTGPLSASGVSAYGGGLGANWRNFLVQGEFYQIDVNQSKLPHVPEPMLGFNGGYVEGSVVLTGEAHPYDIARFGNRASLQHSRSQQQRCPRRAGKRHWRDLWRQATDRRCRARLVPERLDTVHAPIPICRCQ